MWFARKRSFLLKVTFLGGQQHHNTVVCCAFDDVQWVFREFFAKFIACVCRSLINEQFPIWYCTTSAQCCANEIFVPVDSLDILTGPVACRLLANSTCCVGRPTDEIFHLSAIAHMAARTVAQVECLRHAHTRARRSPWRPLLSCIPHFMSPEHPSNKFTRMYHIANIARVCTCVNLSFSASRNRWWWSLPSGRRMSSGLTLYFLWVLEWPIRPILALNCRPQSSQVKRLVSAHLAAGTDWLVKPFRRLRFSTAVTIRTSSKCCTPVRQAFCHLDMLSARSSQVAGSMPVDSRR